LYSCLLHSLILDASPGHQKSPAFRSSQAEARRISLRAVAQVEAEVGSTWPDGCRQAGEMARKVVMAGIAPEKMGQDEPRFLDLGEFCDFLGSK